jgi:hypothetical protein
MDQNRWADFNISFTSIFIYLIALFGFLVVNESRILKKAVCHVMTSSVYALMWGVALK